MKKNIFIAVLTAFFSLVLTGCGGSTTTNVTHNHYGDTNNSSSDNSNVTENGSESTVKVIINGNTIEITNHLGYEVVLGTLTITAVNTPNQQVFRLFVGDQLSDPLGSNMAVGSLTGYSEYEVYLSHVLGAGETVTVVGTSDISDANLSYNIDGTEVNVESNATTEGGTQFDVSDDASFTDENFCGVVTTDFSDVSATLNPDGSVRIHNEGTVDVCVQTVRIRTVNDVGIMQQGPELRYNFSDEGNNTYEVNTYWYLPAGNGFNIVAIRADDGQTKTEIKNAVIINQMI